MTLADIKDQLQHSLDAQDTATAAWHHNSAPAPQDVPADNAAQSLECDILAQHACNFHLWHTEDTARRRDVDATVIADCKRNVDRYNQLRVDAMERVDNWLVERLQPLLPAAAAHRYNTESLGMAIDRLSILSLKIWHMDEQLLRTDVDAAHVERCASKAAMLREQREDLRQAMLDLLDEFASGSKRPKLYFQFKMYNDPTLNPALYAGKTQAGTGKQ